MAADLSSWEMSEKFWDLVKPLIPEKNRTRGRKYLRKPGAGRKAMDRRKVFEAIIYVLRTGIQWKALPKEKFGSSSSIHAYFKAWEKAGVFDKIWRKGLVEYDELEGIAWKWQAIEGTPEKAPQAQESPGASAVNRGGKWEKMASARRRAWRPVVDRRDRRERREKARIDANRHCCFSTIGD